MYKIVATDLILSHSEDPTHVKYREPTCSQSQEPREETLTRSIGGMIREHLDCITGIH